MNPELETLIQNGKSLFAQMESMIKGGGETAAKAEAPTAAAPTDDISPEDIEKVVKMIKDMGAPAGNVVKEQNPNVQGDEAGDPNITAKSDEGTHGGSDPASSAEAVIEDQPKHNEENIKEVAKALIKSMRHGASKSVAKSVDNSSIMAVMKAQEQKIESLNKTLNLMLDGFGIADTVMKSVAPAQVASSPVKDFSNVAKSIDEIQAFVKQATGNKQPEINNGWGWPQDGKTSVRKDLFASLESNLK